MIQSLVEKHVTLRKVTVRECAGACPSCGGDDRTSDRFRVWIDEDRYWCRQCDKRGDSIQFLRDFEGKGCGEAHQIVGKQCTDSLCEGYGKCAATRGEQRQHRPSTTGRTPQPREEKKDAWTPAEPRTPAEIWQEKAAKLVQWAHEQLLQAPEQLAYLDGRGLPLEAVKKYRFGFVPKDTYRDRESWGLPPEFKSDGKKKKLWIPSGIVIPAYVGEVLHRVRIRRTDEALAADQQEKKLRYYAIPGSGDDVIILGRGNKTHMVVEADLDGYMIDWVAGDVVDTLPLTTCSARPREAAYQVLRESLCILGGLDFEPHKDERTGRIVNPGGDNWHKWWAPRFPQAKRWPAPRGKDPGDAYKAGVNIRAWVIAGLPPGLRPATSVQSRTSTETPAPSTKMEVPSPEKAESFTPPPVFTIRSRCGRLVHITDDRREYDRLVREGKIVLDSREFEFLKALAPDPVSAERILDVKEQFPGATITGLQEKPAPSQQQRQPGSCYWKPAA